MARRSPLRSSTSPKVRRRGAGRLKQARQFQIAQVDRLQLLMAAFVLGGFLVSTRLFIVQVLEHPFYEALASGQHELVKQLLPERGEIYAQDRYAEEGISVMATNRTLHLVYVNPQQVGDADQLATEVAPLLGLEKDLVKERAGKENDQYEPLKHQVTDQEIEALEKLIAEKQLTGLHWTEEENRYYPEGEMVGSVTGFVGFVEEQRVGQYGLEGYYDEQLSGSPGELSTELDASGRFIAVGDKTITEAQDGDTLILTIDRNIQYKACSLIGAAVEKHGAKQGSVIVMDPKTGAIMAMCNAPLFDPNNYGDVESIEVFLNDAVSDQYEPGSVFKSITMAAGINEGHVTPYSTFEDTGSVQIGPYTIRNSNGKANGVVDMTKVLEDSLNTGSIHVVSKVGDARWHQYVKDFGFGEPTGIGMSGENPGDISGVAKEREIYSATSSYGQGLTVTPIQLLQAYGALANDGVMMQPYIVDRIIKANGHQEQTEPVVAGNPISADTARTVSAMLVRVIEGGHAIRAQVPGYHFAGKTGTAQIPREDGLGYDGSRHKDTFVAYGPVADPQFVAIVKIDEPKDVMWSDASTAPLFSELGKYLVNYLQIPPDATE
jgi:cell division protein FtsI (penicillin-binding protein 3)/stage V sporulation protein D (sporulation-specific penicillin-binding protein)